MTLAEARDGLAKKSFTSLELTDAHLEAMEAARALNAFVLVTPDRARAIQEALIRENYLTGEPSGAWDTRTQGAMVRYQAANGWQTKVTPDSRALIKLGLGPNYSDKEMLRLDPKPATDAVATNGNAVSPNKQR